MKNGPFHFIGFLNPLKLTYSFITCIYTDDVGDTFISDYSINETYINGFYKINIESVDLIETESPLKSLSFWTGSLPIYCFVKENSDYIIGTYNNIISKLDNILKETYLSDYTKLKVASFLKKHEITQEAVLNINNNKSNIKVFPTSYNIPTIKVNEKLSENLQGFIDNYEFLQENGVDPSGFFILNDKVFAFKDKAFSIEDLLNNLQQVSSSSIIEKCQSIINRLSIGKSYLYDKLINDNDNSFINAYVNCDESGSDNINKRLSPVFKDRFNEFDDNFSIWDEMYESEILLANEFEDLDEEIGFVNSELGNNFLKKNNQYVEEIYNFLK